MVATAVWNFISSSRPWRSEVRTMATSTWTSSSPTTPSTHRPWTGAWIVINPPVSRGPPWPLAPLGRS
jgi:hypothetical protein